MRGKEQPGGRLLKPQWVSEWVSECSSRYSLDHHPQGPVGRIDAWLCRCQTLAGCSRVVRVVCTASLLEPLPVGLIDSWALGAFFPPLPFCFWSQHAFPSFWSFAGTTEQLHSKALSVSVLSILQCGCLAFSFSAAADRGFSSVALRFAGDEDETP